MMYDTFQKLFNINQNKNIFNFKSILIRIMVSDTFQNNFLFENTFRFFLFLKLIHQNHYKTLRKY
jgi:hypothetical protein